jgi:hypothetical protein
MENLDSSTDLELTYVPSGIVVVSFGGGRCSYHMVKPCRSAFPKGNTIP